MGHAYILQGRGVLLTGCRALAWDIKVDKEALGISPSINTSLRLPPSSYNAPDRFPWYVCSSVGGNARRGLGCPSAISLKGLNCTVVAHDQSCWLYLVFGVISERSVQQQAEVVVDMSTAVGIGSRIDTICTFNTLPYPTISFSSTRALKLAFSTPPPLDSTPT
jgi:hypothetical protein